MEDEDIAPNTCTGTYIVHTADPAGMGRKSCMPVHYAGILCTSMTFCPYQLDRCTVVMSMFVSSK